MSAASLLGSVNPNKRYSADDIFNLHGKLNTTKRAAQLAEALFANSPDFGTSIIVTLTRWVKDPQLALEGILLPIVIDWIIGNVADEHYKPACDVFFAEEIAAGLACAILSNPSGSVAESEYYVYDSSQGHWVGCI